MTAHGGQQVLTDQRRGARCLRAGPLQAVERGADAERVVAGFGLLAPPERRLQQQPPLLDLVRDGHAGFELLAQPLAPRAERVPPRLDRVGMPPVAEQLHVPGPAVVVDRPHRCPAPGRLVIGADEDRGVEQVVAVGEDVRGHQQLIPDDALDRITPAVQLRGDPLDDDAAPAADRVGPRLRWLDDRGDRASHACFRGGHEWLKPYPIGPAIGISRRSRPQSDRCGCFVMAPRSCS